MNRRARGTGEIRLVGNVYKIRYTLNGRRIQERAGPGFWTRAEVAAVASAGAESTTPGLVVSGWRVGRLAGAVPRACLMGALLALAFLLASASGCAEPGAVEPPVSPSVRLRVEATLRRCELYATAQGSGALTLSLLHEDGSVITVLGATVRDSATLWTVVPDTALLVAWTFATERGEERMPSCQV